MVLTAAAPRLRDRLSGLVYYSAFVPLDGESLHDLVPPPYQELFGELAGASPDNSVALPLEVWRGAFMQDAEAGTQEIVHNLMLPQPYAYFTDKVTGVDYASLGVPTSYVISPDDVALPPGDFAWSPRFPDRLPGAHLLERTHSHESMFTAPQDVATALIAAAEACG